MAMKTVISYVAGTAGDFLVNCCNHVWQPEFNGTGTVLPSASIKNLEHKLNDYEITDTIKSMPFDYIGSHSVDRLLRLAVRPLWLVSPNKDQFSIWVARDAVTRRPDNVVGRYGDLYHAICDLIHADQSQAAAKIFLSWLHDYNWTLMQMRMVQASNKIDVSALLQPHGIDTVIDQLPELEPVAAHCRQYHAVWLKHQHPLADTAWVIEHVASKLKQFVQEA